MKNLEKSMVELYNDPKKFENYLSKRLNFSQYSDLNQAYILSQNPQAKYVATYNQWKKLGFQVVEKGAMHILAPVMLKGFIDEEGRWCNQNKATEVQKSKIEAGILKKKDMLYRYRDCPVFDISKTNVSEDDLVKLVSKREMKEEVGLINEESVYDALTRYYSYTSNKETKVEKNYDIVYQIVKGNVEKKEDVMPEEKDFFISAATYIVIQQLHLKNLYFDYESMKKLTKDGEKLINMHQKLLKFAKEQTEQVAVAFIQ